MESAASAAARRDAPKRRLTSTHVNVWFNSPDKVQMYYEDARARNVWHGFGEWGSTWPRINELDLDPSKTGPNGGTRFMVENKTTGQTFIVDKSNATFTATADGKTRIAIEDRPGSGTHGSDIVLLLEPKFEQPARSSPGLSGSSKNRKLMGQSIPVPPAIEKDIQTFMDARKPWPERRNALNAVFLDRASRTQDDSMRKLLLALHTGIVALRGGLPSSIYVRLGTTMKQMYRGDFFFSNSRTRFAAVRGHLPAEKQSLVVNPEFLKSADPQKLASVMAHELAHLAFEERNAGSVSLNLVSKPPLQAVIETSAKALGIKVGEAKRLLVLTLREALVEDACSRIVINGKPIELPPDNSLAQLRPFTAQLKKLLPKDFRAPKMRSSYLLARAAAPSWLYDKQVAAAFAAPSNIHRKPEVGGDVVVRFQPKDSWLTTFIKLEQAKQLRFSGPVHTDLR
jgi:hypothetical protein